MVFECKNFTTLAHEVFKLKKRLRKNEEECKEEWPGSKKSKFSYTKPTVDKVTTIFRNFKSSKIFNVESLRKIYYVVMGNGFMIIIF